MIGEGRHRQASQANFMLQEEAAQTAGEAAKIARAFCSSPIGLNILSARRRSSVFEKNTGL